MDGGRLGFTTGACAAAAALAAACVAQGRVAPAEVELPFPDGSRRRLPVDWVRPMYGGAEAAVRKDAGDDPDITHGAEVIAQVRRDVAWVFEAGEGVGTVTRPGLQILPGEAAINPGPRAMIRAALESLGWRGARVRISIPGGAELAARTFNPRLGVEGGLSILGTTGIVRPFSLEAVQTTVRCNLDVVRASGAETVALVPGHLGERALKAALATEHRDPAPRRHSNREAPATATAPHHRPDRSLQIPRKLLSHSYLLKNIFKNPSNKDERDEGDNNEHIQTSSNISHPDLRSDRSIQAHQRLLSLSSLSSLLINSFKDDQVRDARDEEPQIQASSSTFNPYLRKDRSLQAPRRLLSPASPSSLLKRSFKNGSNKDARDERDNDEHVQTSLNISHPDLRPDRSLQAHQRLLSLSSLSSLLINSFKNDQVGDARDEEPQIQASSGTSNPYLRKDWYLQAPRRLLSPASPSSLLKRSFKNGSNKDARDERDGEQWLCPQTPTIRPVLSSDPQHPCLEIVEVSNEWGVALDHAAALGFRRLLLAGHPGKLAKLAEGHFDTHSSRSPGPVPGVAEHMRALGLPVPEVPTVEGLFQSLGKEGQARLSTRLGQAIAAAAEARCGLPCDVLLTTLQAGCYGGWREGEPWR